MDSPLLPNLGPALIAVNWIFAVVSLAVVASRFHVRLRMMKTIRLDDWLIIITWILAIGNSVFCTISVSYGIGQHIETLQPEQVTMAIKYIYLCEFFSIMSPGIGRISYAFLLLDLVPKTKKRKNFLWAIIGAQFIVDIGTVIISFSQCQPIQAFWDKHVQGNCWDPKVQESTGFFQGSVCSLVDLLLAVFPASLFWNLQMKTAAKVSLSILMGLGIFAMVASIVKTIELQAIGATEDLTHQMAILALWWTAEAYVVLIAASIPTLRPLMNARRGLSTADTLTDQSKPDSTGRRLTQGSHAARHSSLGSSDVDGPEIRDPHAFLATNSSSENLWKSEDMGSYHYGLALNQISKHTTMQVDYERNRPSNALIPMYSTTAVRAGNARPTRAV